MINTIRSTFLKFVIFVHALGYLQVWLNLNEDYLIFKIFRNHFQPASLLAFLSGFLYFNNIEKISQKRIFTKDSHYIKRIKNVLKPYLSWSIIIWVLLLISKEIIVLLNLNIYFKFIHVIQTNPIFLIKSILLPDSHIWFLHNLIFALIISPLLKRRDVRIILLLTLPLVYNQSLIFENCIRFRFIIFYVLGTHISIDKKNTAWLSTGLLAFLSSQIFYQILIPDYTLHLYIYKPIVMFIFITTILYFLDIKDQNNFNRQKHFFLYIIHPYLIALLTKSIIFLIIPLSLYFKSQFSILLFSILSTLITIGLINLFFKLVNNKFKQIVSFIF